MLRRLSSLLLVVLLLVSSLLTGCAAKPTEAYKIGFVASITGGPTFLGVPERDAAVMLQKQFDAAGGIKGADGKMHPVKIVILDTEGSGDVAVTVVKKLIDDEKVLAIIGPTSSPVAMAILPIVERAEISLVAMASSSDIAKPASERKWVFKTAWSNEHTAPWQVTYCKAKGITKIANLYVDNAYGEDGVSAIRTTAEAEGIQILLEEKFGAADTDFAAILTKVKASDAEAVVVTAIPPAAAILTKQYRELGVELPLVHNSGVAMKPFIDLAGADIAEGVVFPMGKLVAADQLPDSDPQKAVLQKFVADYEAETGTAPSTFSGHAWDAVMLITQVLETMPAKLDLQEQRAYIRDGLENTQGFVGIDGVFNMSASDHVGLSTSDVVLARIHNGDWEYFPEDMW